MIRTLPALLTVLTVGAVTLAAHPFQAARLDISGTWTGKTIITKEGAPPSEEGLHAVLKQHGSEITGTVGPSVERQFPINTGKVETSEQETTVSFESGRRGHKLFFTAQLVDGVMKGTVKDEYYKSTLQIELKRSK